MILARLASTRASSLALTRGASLVSPRGATRPAALFVLLSLALGGHAQALATGATAPASTASAAGGGPTGIVPSARGFNLSLGSTTQHDSGSGWSSLLTPDLAYRFGSHLSVNVSLPIYATVDTYQKTAPAHGNTPAVYDFVNHHLVLGDGAAVAEVDTHPAGFDDELSATLGIPTGSPAQGLGAGHSTYEISNHIERSLGDLLTPEFEFGFDNSPNLNDRRVRKSYTVAGNSAHIQGGLGISLPRRINFSTDMYEDLPLGSQSITGKKKKKKAASSSQTDAEDNGFLNTLDIPATSHVTVSGFYNHSLHDGTDIAGVTLTFLLRPAPHPDDSSH